MRLYSFFVCTVVILTMSISGKSADDSVFFNGTFEEACKIAETNDKNVFLDFYTVWCGGCILYDRYVFPDSSIREYLANNFICLKIDGEKKEHQSITKKFKI